MRRPSVRFLPREWAHVARRIAERLAGAGHRAWIVGGTPRDLALGVTPGDVDMASAATPDEVEALFEHTHAVGKAFGTVVVGIEGRDVQLTTFRSEAGYSDGRRPDEVRWGSSALEDARRRDFTCNALYLDPLDDTVLDPTGGLEDLAARRLRCVGDPDERFREDGLRLVRLARFGASLGFEIDPATLRAARAETHALAGVSPERVGAELRRVLTFPDPARAFELLVEIGIEGVLFAAAESLPGTFARRLAALRALGPAPGFVAGLAVLFDPGPLDHPQASARSAAESLALSLRPSREERRALADLWNLAAETRAVLALGDVPRARRVRLVRADRWPLAARHVRAWLVAESLPAGALDRLVAWSEGLDERELRPPALVTSDDLRAAGVESGRRWGELLEAAETAQLEGEIDTREAGLAWLAARVRSGR